MESKQKIIFEKGVFLNKKGQHSVASIWGRLERCPNDQKTHFSYDGQLKIRDCSTVIHLNLDWCSDPRRSGQTRDGVLYKLDTMIKFLSMYKKAIEEKT